MALTTNAALGYSNIITSFGSILMTREEGKLNRSIAEHNQIMSEYEMWWTQHAMELTEEQLRREGARVLGAARAINAASGFATDSRTNLAVEGDIIEGIELDAAILRVRGGLEMFRSFSAAGQYGLQSRMASSEANLKIAEILARDIPEISKTFAKKEE